MHKVKKAQAGLKKRAEETTSQEVERSPEEQIRYNRDLVQDFFSSVFYHEIYYPLLEECKASVSGRFTNGRFYKGDLTLKPESNRDLLAGYQMALEDFHNRIHDFIVFANNLEKRQKEEQAEKGIEVINPFLDDANDETN